MRGKALLGWEDTGALGPCLPGQEGSVKVQSSRSATAPMVTAQGERLVSHAGVGMLAEVADLSGLTGGLSGVFARPGVRGRGAARWGWPGGWGGLSPRQGVRWRHHPPGVTLARAAAAIADGMANVT